MENSIPYSQLLIIILGSGGIGAIVTTFISQFIQLKNSKNERKFSFRKEQFLILQNKAQKIFDYVYENDVILSTMVVKMKAGTLDNDVFNEDDLKRIRKEFYIILNIHFPSSIYQNIFL